MIINYNIYDEREKKNFENNAKNGFSPDRIRTEDLDFATAWRHRFAINWYRVDSLFVRYL